DGELAPGPVDQSTGAPLRYQHGDQVTEIDDVGPPRGPRVLEGESAPGQPDAGRRIRAAPAPASSRDREDPLRLRRLGLGGSDLRHLQEPSMRGEVEVGGV